MPLAQWKEFSPAFDNNLSTVLALDSALARRAVRGATAPSAVRSALEDFNTRLGKLEENL